MCVCMLCYFVQFWPLHYEIFIPKIIQINNIQLRNYNLNLLPHAIAGLKNHLQRY